MIRKSLRLTALLSMLLAVVACAPALTFNLGTRDEIIDTLQSGSIRLECTLPCAWTWGNERARLRTLDASGNWESLAIEVAQIGYQKDLAYYYLGRAAEGLGHRDAARRYYYESYALATGSQSGPKCRSVADDCNGVDLLAILPMKLNPPGAANSSALKPGVPTTVVTTTKNENMAISKYISRKASATGSTEYEEARTVVTGARDDEGAFGLAVTYTLERGNSSDFYLAAFVSRKGKLELLGDAQVGNRCSRFVTLRKIEGSTISLDFEEHSQQDACCCPSRKGTTQFILSGNGEKKALREVRKTYFK